MSRSYEELEAIATLNDCRAELVGLRDEVRRLQRESMNHRLTVAAEMRDTLQRYAAVCQRDSIAFPMGTHLQRLAQDLDRWIGQVVKQGLGI